MSEPIEQMNQLIAHGKKDINLCPIAYKIIEDAPAAQQAHLLCVFLTGFKFGTMDGALELPKLIDDHQEVALMKKYCRMVDRHLYGYMDIGLSENEFYQKLWEFISSTPLLPDLTARATALFDCAIDRRIPYFYIDPSKPISMEDQELHTRMKSLGTDFHARLQYYLNTKFDEKTQQASMLVDMLDALPDRVTRTVAMVVLIAYYQWRLARSHFGAGMLSHLLADNDDDELDLPEDLLELFSGESSDESE